MTVHERIAQAMQVIAETDFDKSGKVQGGVSYSFIPIGQILQAVRKAHAKAGLFLTTGQLEYEKDSGEGVFVNDRMTKARGHCEVTINGADGDHISFIVPFNVQDNSDKLDNKIITNIERQAYRVLYAIDEGDATDPEAEWREDEVTVAPQKRAAPAPNNPADKRISPQRAKLLKKLTDIILEGGADGEIINKMVGDFNKSSLDYCKTEELEEILRNVRPFEQYDRRAGQ